MVGVGVGAGEAMRVVRGEEGRGGGWDACYDTRSAFVFLFFLFFILRRVGQNKALAHHTSTYFHTRRVSI